MLETLSCSAPAIVPVKFCTDGDDLDIRLNQTLRGYLAARLPGYHSKFFKMATVYRAYGLRLERGSRRTRAIARRALQFLIEHPAKAEEMGRRGAEAVRRQFNWHNEERKLIEFYIQLIGRHEGCLVLQDIVRSILSPRQCKLQERVCNQCAEFSDRLDSRAIFDPEEFARFVSLTDLVSYRGPDDSDYLALAAGDGPAFRSAR